ncbi:hypothetical protein [Pseudomonas aeruginosa]|uniref:hypothetical protein n=1 Tax=Pseudomonas aeruginosa TaxID=287 RepID=UPI000B318881|nr:hypothetical protein [Pseudomonas aeruginosa]
MEEPRKPSYFVRFMVAALCVLLAAMILFRYLAVDPKGEITSGVITLLGFLIVLVLAESFDNFSVGKLITISREITKKEREVDKLERQNAQLLSQVLSVTNTQAQHQNHTNVYGDYHAAPSVERASALDVQESQSADAVPSTSPELSEVIRERINIRAATAIALTKYFAERSINTLNVIHDAKLVSHFKDIDPISNFQPIFDAYFNDGENEIFVDVRIKRNSPLFIRDRLYVMLSKIHHYRVARRINARLDLILISMPNTEESPRLNSNFYRILESFEPAIANGTLKIHETVFTEEERIASLVQ